MMHMSDLGAGDRKTGRVVRVLGDYGFVACDEVPDEDLYFKTSWFRGDSPLQEGDVVSFIIKQFGATPRPTISFGPQMKQLSEIQDKSDEVAYQPHSTFLSGRIWVIFQTL